MNKIKRIVALVLLVVASVSFAQAQKSEISYTATEEFELSNLNAFDVPIVSHKFNPKSGKGIIKLDGAVTRINQEAFQDCEAITSISLPETIRSVGENAFDGCVNLAQVVIKDLAAWCQIDFEHNANPLRYANDLLMGKDRITKVVVPTGVTRIGNNAFNGYKGLRHVRINTGVTEIGLGAFADCEDLQNIYLAESVKSIGVAAFKGCSNLQSITLNQNITSIEEYLFAGCRSLQSITIPNRVTCISQYAFSDCTSLKNLTIPRSVTDICKGAFKSCTNIKSVTLPGSVTTIQDEAFAECRGIEKLSIGSGIKELSASAFEECSKIIEVTLPSSVMRLGDSVFSGCTALQRVVLNEGLTEIGSGAFTGCVALSSITIPQSVTSIASETFSSCTSLHTVKLHDAITHIGSYAFNNCSALRNVTLPSGLKFVDDATFKGCTSLANITLPDTITEIGREAFALCSMLKMINVPREITHIEASAFEGCQVFKSIVVPDSVTSRIEFKCFDTVESLEIGAAVNYLPQISTWLPSLREVKLTASATVVDDEAFKNCSQLESIELHEGVISIGKGAFANCESLKEIRLPKGIMAIEEHTFKGCKNLANVTITENITKIGRGAFADCDSFTHIVIPDNVTSIATEVFSDCDQLEALTIGKALNIVPNLYQVCAGVRTLNIAEGVTTISKGALKDCISLREVNIAEGVTEIGAGAFSGCIAIERFTLPQSLSVIGERAFEKCQKLQTLELGGATKFDTEHIGGCQSLKSIVVGENMKHIVVHSEDDIVLCNKLFDRLDGIESLSLGKGFEEMTGQYNLLNSWTALRELGISSDVKTLKYTLTGLDLGNIHRVTVDDFASFLAIDYITYECDQAWPAEGLLANSDIYNTEGKLIVEHDPKQIVIPDGATKLGWGAFCGCYKLQDVTIPRSVKTIGRGAFNGCKSLCRFTGNFASDDGHCLVKDGVLIAVAMAESSTLYIPQSVNSFESDVFYDCNLISAFDGKFASSDGRCLVRNGVLVAIASKNLVSYTLPSNVTKLGENIGNYPSLIDLTIPENVKSLSSTDFYGCEKLERVAVPRHLQDMAEETFSNVANLSFY